MLSVFYQIKLNPIDTKIRVFDIYNYNCMVK